MATSRHIVLVDPLGEILFSGESLSAKAPEPAAEELDLCPETKRSAESGTYRAVDPRLSVSEARVTPASEATVDSDCAGAGSETDACAGEDEGEEVATPKRGFRAA